MVIVGIHKDPWHDTGAAVIHVSSNKVEYAMLSQERADRVKDSRAYPADALRLCLKEFGLDSLSQADLVVLDYIRKPDWRNDQFSEPCVDVPELEALPPERVKVINHHLCHAASAFYSSGFKEAAILVVDGRGSDQETQSLYIASGNDIELVDKTSTIGIGLLYAAVTQTIGFKLLQEGKTMGLAPFGKDVDEPVFEFERRFDGIVTDYSHICVEGNYDLKIPHRPIETFEDKSRAAFDVQEECEAAMLHLAKWAKEKTGMDNLCITGGVALNSVANYKVLASGIFDDVFVNPAASDTGIPFGAALYGLHNIIGAASPQEKISPFLGPTYSGERLLEAIASFVGYETVAESAVDKAVELLSQNKIVACFNGRSEIGPRALGNRSILMSPLLAENKETLNSRVKHREAFRPFAPVALEEVYEDYFEIDRPCPYMLFVPKVKEDKQSIIPAVTHVDGTGRLQTVSKSENPLLHQIISKFGEITGVPIILNTSFNDNNEPIVETPEDAIKCFSKTNIDALLIENNFILIKN